MFVRVNTMIGEEMLINTSMIAAILPKYSQIIMRCPVNSMGHERLTLDPDSIQKVLQAIDHVMWIQ